MGVSLVSSKERTNGTRLLLLIIDICTHVLREQFLSIHPPETLDEVFKKNKAKLLRKSTKDQKEKLYPSSDKAADAGEFDISLLYLLLQHICNVEPPKTGWTVMPAVDDRSFGANILRLKQFRNELYAHRPYVKIPDDEFELKWNEISAVSVDLGGEQEMIDRLKTQAIDHDTERRVEKERKRILEIDARVQNLERGQEDVEGRVENTEDRVEDLESQMSALKQQLLDFQTTGAHRPPEEVSCALHDQISGSKKAGLDGGNTIPSTVRDEFFELIGRSRELDAAVKSIEGGKDDIVFIHGPPGSGKSILMQKVIERLVVERNDWTHQSGEVLFIPFSSIKSPRVHALDKVYTMLNYAFGNSRQPQSEEPPKASLLHFCEQLAEGNHKVIIALDNIDEVVVEDRGELLSLVSDMRALSKGNVTFLMSSQTPFTAYHTHAYNLRIKELKLGPLAKEAATQVFLSNIGIKSEKMRQNLTETQKIVKLCAGVPGRLVEAASSLLRPNFTERDVIENLKRQNASRKLEKSLQWKNRTRSRITKLPQRQFSTFFLNVGAKVISVLKRRF